MEPILDMYKPPGLIKKIYFRRLTFGNAPIRIDNVWVDKQTPEELILEVSPELTPILRLYPDKLNLAPASVTKMNFSKRKLQRLLFVTTKHGMCSPAK